MRRSVRTRGRFCRDGRFTGVILARPRTVPSVTVSPSPCCRSLPLPFRKNPLIFQCAWFIIIISMTIIIIFTIVTWWGPRPC